MKVGLERAQAPICLQIALTIKGIRLPFIGKVQSGALYFSGAEMDWHRLTHLVIEASGLSVGTPRICLRD